MHSENGLHIEIIFLLLKNRNMIMHSWASAIRWQVQSLCSDLFDQCRLSNRGPVINFYAKWGRLEFMRIDLGGVANFFYISYIYNFLKRRNCNKDLLCLQFRILINSTVMYFYFKFVLKCNFAYTSTKKYPYKYNNFTFNKKHKNPVLDQTDTIHYHLRLHFHCCHVHCLQMCKL